MPALELDVLFVGPWFHALYKPVGDLCTFICTKKIGSSRIRAGRVAALYESGPGYRLSDCDSKLSLRASPSS